MARLAGAVPAAPVTTMEGALDLERLHLSLLGELELSGISLVR